MVASLPQHHHIFAEPGCFKGHKNDGNGKRRVVNIQCAEGNNPQAKAVETPLPDAFKPLKLDLSMDEAWEKLVFGKTTADREAEQNAVKKVASS